MNPCRHGFTRRIDVGEAVGAVGKSSATSERETENNEQVFHVSGSGMDWSPLVVKNCGTAGFGGLGGGEGNGGLGNGVG